MRYFHKTVLAAEEEGKIMPKLGSSLESSLSKCQLRNPDVDIKSLEIIFGNAKIVNMCAITNTNLKILFPLENAKKTLDPSFLGKAACTTVNKYN